MQIPYVILYPAVVCFICIGVYSVRNSAFDIFVVLAFGMLGCVLRLLRFELAPILIGFILGPMIEDNFKRAMLLARGDFIKIVERPVSAVLLSLTLILVFWSIWSALRPSRQMRDSE